MDRLTSMLLFKSDLEASKELEILQSFCETSSLVFDCIMSSVFGIPSSKFFPSLFKVDTKRAANKHKFYSLLDENKSEQLLKELKCLKINEIQGLGSEFFSALTKKIAKYSTIQMYFSFLEVILEPLDYDQKTIKTFFSTPRTLNSMNEIFRCVDNSNLTQKEELKKQLIYQGVVNLASKVEKNEFHQFVSHFKNEIKESKSENIRVALIKHYIRKIAEKDTLENLKTEINLYRSAGFKIDEYTVFKTATIALKSWREDELVYWVYTECVKEGTQLSLPAFNQLLEYFATIKNLEKAQAVFIQMTDQYPLDFIGVFTFLKVFKSEKEVVIRLDIIEDILQKIKKSKIMEVNLYNNIIDILIFYKHFDLANVALENMKDLGIDFNISTYNIIIRGACKEKNLEKAMGYFKRLEQSNIKPNKITYNFLMDLAVKVKKLNLAFNLAEDMVKNGIDQDEYSYSILLNGTKISDSPESLVRSILEKVRASILSPNFKADDILFNTIFEICNKYNLEEEFQSFIKLSEQLKIRISIQAYSIMIKFYGKINKFDLSLALYEDMKLKNIYISDMVYGCILDACSKSGQIAHALRIYDEMKNGKVAVNSIIFTTILKMYSISNRYDDAINFFKAIPNKKDYPGIEITYNCLLDVYVKKKDLTMATEIFREIEKNFKADLVSYSTLIKGLCVAERKQEALLLMKQFLEIPDIFDISIVNFYLEACANFKDFNLGLQMYKYLQLKNIIPSEVSYGILIKIFGFSKNLKACFELLDLMAVYQMEPSIVIFTNLIHNSFLNKQPKKAELAYNLARKAGIKCDCLMYTKIIDGFMRIGDKEKAIQYLKYTIDNQCTLKSDLIETLYQEFKNSSEILLLLDQVKQLAKVENYKKFKGAGVKNSYNVDHPKKYKQQIKDNQKNLELKTETKPKKHIINEGYQKFTNSNNINKETGKKEDLKLFNFRKNPVTHD